MKSISPIIRLIVVPLIIVFGIIGITACGGGGGGNSTSQNEDDNGNDSIDSLELKGLFTAPDPEDSLLSRIEFEANNAEGLEAVEIYKSDGNSDSEKITSQIYVTGESKPYMFFHDDMGRVERIDGPDGTGVKFDYTDSAVFFNYITPDKQIGAGSVPIEGELKEFLDKLANDYTSTSDVWISDTKALSMDEENDFKDINIQSTEYPLRYTLEMRATVTLVNNTFDLRNIPVDGADISCPNTEGYSCHLTTVRDIGWREDYDGTPYLTSIVEIVVRKEVVITADQVLVLTNGCHSQNAKARAEWAKTSQGVGGVSAAMTTCALLGWGPASPITLIGAIATYAGFGMGEVDADIHPDCTMYADRQAAVQLIPDEELEITIAPYSHIYDIVSNPIKIEVTPSCLVNGENCGDYYEYKWYSFTGVTNSGINRALIACDVCPSGLTEPNAHLELTASLPETTEFHTLDEIDGQPALYYAAPGDENTCGGDDLFEEEVCDDGIDNDGDGKIDQADEDCASSQPNPGAESMSGYFSATCASGYGDGSDFSVTIDSNGIVTGSYDWGEISGAVVDGFMSVELDGDWSDCVMGGDISGSGNGLSGEGTVYCSGDDCYGNWEARHGGLSQ